MDITPDTRRVIFLLSLYLLSVLGIVFLIPVNYFPEPKTEMIADMGFQLNSSENPTYLSQDWTPVKLPHDWHLSDVKGSQIWYRASFDAPLSDGDIWGVYIPHVTHNAEVYVNRNWIGRGGRFKDPVARLHNQPLLFTFDGNLISPQTNDILIRVKSASSHQGLLDGIYIAPLDKLEYSYHWKQFVRVDLIHYTSAGMFLLGLVIFYFWLSHRKEGIYLVFSLQLFAWSIHNLNLFVVNIPFSSRLWEAMIMVTLGWSVIFMIIFNHHFLRESHHRIEQALLVVGVSGLGIFLLPDIETVLTIGYIFWDGFLIIAGSYTVFFLCSYYFKSVTKNPDNRSPEESRNSLLMIIVGVPILVFGLHDILLVNHYIDRKQGLIIQYSAIPTVLLFTWFLVRHFVQSLNTANELSRHLELRVKEKESELVNQFERLRSLERDQLLAKERERIMQDIHDGIGGQLVSVAAFLQNEQEDKLKPIYEKVVDSINDLRLVINSMDPAVRDIPGLLSTLRHRMESQLKSADMTLCWEISDKDPVTIGPRQGLHILRIVQESVTNAVKHSGASEVSVSYYSKPGTPPVIEISDNGQGFNWDKNTVDGRGLKNLRFRAKELEADLEISSSTGTTISLVFSNLV